SEQEGAERADQKARGEQGDRAEQRRHRVAFFEEFDRQDGGQAAEDVEVIPLDDITARRSGNHASEVRWNASSHIVLSLGLKDWLSRMLHCYGQWQSLTLTQGC